MGPLVFGTRSYATLAEGIRLAGGLKAGERELRLFPDGERYQRLLTAVHGRNVALVGGTIYDDMIRTGGSLLAAAAAYRQAGAVEVAAVATHGLFPGDSLGRLQGSGLLSAVVTTDSHPRAVTLADGFLTLVSVAPLLAEPSSPPGDVSRAC